MTASSSGVYDFGALPPVTTFTVINKVNAAEAVPRMAEKMPSLCPAEKRRPSEVTNATAATGDMVVGGMGLVVLGAW